MKDVRAAHGPKGRPIPGEPSPTGEIEPEPEAEPVTETVTPTCGTESEAAPMFATMAEFKDAAAVGSVWRKALWQNGAWEYSPMVRTVAHTQTRDIASAWGYHTPERAAEIGEKSRGNLVWMAFPKRGEWKSDERGLIVLYPDGTPNFRYDPVQGEPYGPPAPAQEPQDCETAEAPLPEPVEVDNAASAPEIEPQADQGEASDPLADILARLEAIEAQLAAVDALPGESVATPTEAIQRPKRTPAHERAIRRAWAERKARRMAQAGYDGERIRANDAVQEREKYRGWWENVSRDAAALCAERDALQVKRRRSTTLARDLQKRLNAEHRLVEQVNEKRRTAEQERDRARTWGESLREKLANAEARVCSLGGTAERAKAELARIKRDMADPSQPERASDIARLVQERDTARNALSAMQQRCERQEAALQRGAEAIEQYGLRLAQAEAKLRKLAA